MYDSNHKGISYNAGFFMLIAFTIGGIVAAGIIGGVVFQQMTGVKFTDMAIAMKDPANYQASRISQAIASIIGFMAPSMLVAAMLHRKPFSLMGFDGKIQAKQIGLVILLTGSAMMISSSLGVLSHDLPYPNSWVRYFNQLEASYKEQVAGIIGLDTIPDFLVSLVVMAFLPALCEEVLFRGGLQNFLSRGTKKPWLAIIVVSLIFSIVHLSAYGFLSRMFLGVALGAIYHYSGRLWLAILAHFINNAVAISMAFYLKQHNKSLLDAMDDANGNYWGLLFIPLFIIALLALARISPKKQLERDHEEEDRSFLLK